MAPISPQQPADILGFRPDINGLRAYAVLMVVGYHFMLPFVDSGFSGVDVFFVISGFLMASIIVPKLDSNQFNLTRFYSARLRRIFPALATVVGTLLLFGWFNLGPTDYTQLGKQAVSAISFFSNFIFRAEEGYFDAPSREKWLLHTWSLGVEAQFYAMFPLLLLAIRRCSSTTRLRTLWTIAIISLVLCIAFSPTENAFAFYLLPTRAWELLAGSLVYLHGPFTRAIAYQRWVALFGMLLVVSGSFFFGHAPLWPGYFALWPVAGTALVLAAQHQRAWLISNPVAQHLGRWSYSIYLWHWPVALLFDYFEIAAPWIGIALSIGLGALSYHTIEQPCRRFGERQPQRISWRWLVVTWAALVCTGSIIWQQHGFPTRLSQAIQQVDAERQNGLKLKTRCGFENDGSLTPCVIGNAKDIGFVLWGDSHAGSVALALQEATHRGILYYTHSCATLFGTELRGKEKRNRCREFNERVMEQVSALPISVPVIIANRYAMHLHGENESIQPVYGIHYYDPPTEGDPVALYREHMEKTLCRIAEKHRTYLVLPQPEIGVDVPRLMVRFMLNGSDNTSVTLPLTEYKKRNAETLPALRHAASRCNVTLLDPVPYLCPDGNRCLASKDGMPLYTDDDHLSARGNQLLVPLFKTLR